MSPDYKARCPQCQQIFPARRSTVGFETACPACKTSFILDIFAFVFDSKEETVAFRKQYIDDQIAPILQKMKDDLAAKRKGLLPLADEIHTLHSIEPIPSAALSVPAFWLRQTNPDTHTEAVDRELSIAKMRPSARQYQTSVFLDCIIDSVLATLDPIVNSGLESRDGLFFTEMPSAQIAFAAHTLDDRGTFVALSNAAVTTLSAMNYHVINAAKAAIQRETDHHHERLLRLVWYLLLGGSDRLLETTGEFLDALGSMSRDPQRKNIIYTSIVLAEHQLRFVIAHELGHVLASHSAVPESELWNEIRKVSVNVLHGGVYDIIAPTVPVSQIPQDILERLNSVNPTTSLNKSQSCELDADQIAVLLCIDEHDRALRRLPEFVAKSRRPDFVEWVWTKQLFCERGRALFADASTTLWVYSLSQM